MVILFDTQSKLLYLEYTLRKLYGLSEDMSIHRGDTLRPFGDLYKEYCVIYDTLIL